MGKRFGPFARMLLNYDYTFVAMLSIELSKKGSECVKGRCPFNPFNKCPNCRTESDAFKLTSSMTAVMFYYKLCDNIHDSGFFGKIGWRFLKLIAAPMRRKAKKEQPQLDEMVSTYIDDQLKAEQEEVRSLDAVAEPTAKLISALAGLLVKDGNNEMLKKFGYYLGRWIYQIDAQDDLEKDIKKKSFNPIAEKFGLTKEDVKNNTDKLKEAHIYANECMNMTMSAMLDYYDILDLDEYKSVLDNIVFMGMPNSQKSAMHLEKDE